MADPLMLLPPEKQALLARITRLLGVIKGVEVVVLGGSSARGMARPDSDLDVGIYYHDAAPFALDDIRAAAAAISVNGPPRVTGFYEWGAWVNGGAWIQTAHGKVDFLYRSLEHVRRAIDDARRGVIHHDYDQQPAYGFYSVIYLSETSLCYPLYDPLKKVAALKAQVAEYPPALRDKVITSGLWLAEFTLLHADGYAAAGNVYTTTGALGRAASYLVQALFGLNRVYFTGDKTALREIEGFAICPPGFATRLPEILAAPGRSPAELAVAVAALRGLWSEVGDAAREDAVREDAAREDAARSE